MKKIKMQMEEPDKLKSVNGALAGLTQTSPLQVMRLPQDIPALHATSTSQNIPSVQDMLTLQDKSPLQAEPLILDMTTLQVIPLLQDTPALWVTPVLQPKVEPAQIMSSHGIPFQELQVREMLLDLNQQSQMNFPKKRTMTEAGYSRTVNKRPKCRTKERLRTISHINIQGVRAKGQQISEVRAHKSFNSALALL
ncbi:unnamed protein product [Blepharisma stoltei]|uniref:Uncharacterized protein n=1 Tax=Blepharisma stoltei TaxID=1481888 RepID=A0AAU9JS94_9CILI|nr:unnamed protein product [Blepharisma stoltei]